MSTNRRQWSSRTLLAGPRVEIYITARHDDVARHESNVYSFARFLVAVGSLLLTIYPAVVSPDRITLPLVNGL